MMFIIDGITYNEIEAKELAKQDGSIMTTVIENKKIITIDRLDTLFNDY